METSEKYKGKRLCYKYHELVVTQNVKRVKFEQIQDLIQRPVVSIRAHSVADITDVPSGATAISAAAFISGYLVISNNGEEELDRIPLIALRPAVNNGVKFECDYKNVDWQKSYVEFGDESLPVTGTAIYFGFGYYKD